MLVLLLLPLPLPASVFWIPSKDHSNRASSYLHLRSVI